MTRIIAILGLLAVAALMGVFAPSIAGSIDGLSESGLWMLIGALAFILVCAAAWTILGAIDRGGKDQPSARARHVPGHTQNPATYNKNGAGLSPRAA